MLQITSSLVASKSSSTGEYCVKEINNGNVVDETHVVDKIKISFFIPRARLAFANLKYLSV